MFKFGTASLKTNGKQTHDVIEARYAYALALKILGEDYRQALIEELEMTESVVIDYELKSEEFFRLSKKFRRHVEEVVTKFDDYGRFNQYASSHPAKVDVLLQIFADPKAPKRVELPGSKRGKTLHSFNFTSGEEAAMQRACEESEEFMNRYGKGLSQMPIVDRRYYE